MKAVTTTRIPIWVRVPATIVLVLIGVVVSAVLAGAAGVGGGAGPDKHAPVPGQDQNQHAPNQHGPNQHGPK
jgi:hypothetical protein